MASSTDDLLKQPPFRSLNDKTDLDDSFCRALKEELCFNYDNNELYHTFCEKKGFDPHDFEGVLDEIPPVHVSVFKELGNKLSSVEKREIKITLQSSATSGVPSSIPVDSVTSKRQIKAMIKVLGEYIGNERRPFLIMDIDPASGFREVLGARYAAVSGYLNFASDARYFLKVDEGNRYYFVEEEINRYIKSINGESVIVFGFTYIFYSQVIKPMMDNGKRFCLPKGSKIIHIGGWKKLESEKISKAKFNKATAELFGVQEEDIIDIYGFTEQMGLNYPDCPCGCKHTPLYSDLIVRDLITKKPLKAGQEGLLEFISPIPHSYPGNAVLTDDIGLIVEGECPYHRSGKRFMVSGRLKKAEIRGCGDILSEKLKFINDMKKGMPSNSNNNRNFVRVLHGLDLNWEEMSGKAVITDIVNELKNHLQWLRKQPIDALIGLIDKVSQKWKLSGELGERRDQDIDFLASWCEAENMVRIANEGLRGNRHFADEFAPVDDLGIQYQRSTSRGVVCHWLAGNVKALGMFVLLQGVLTKNVNLIRVSSRDKGTFCELLDAFRAEEYTTSGGFTVRGDDLLKTIAVITFERENIEAGKTMSMLSDVRVAWGGSEAVSAVTSFPTKYDCQDIIFGPKLSFSVIAKEAIPDERKARKLARRVAIDASVFDQTGCASTHNVFVEEGADISPRMFAEYLADGMMKVARQLPKGSMSPEEISNVHAARGIYDFKGIVYGDDDYIWTVLYEETPELNKPVYSRVIFVHATHELQDVLEFVSDDIQTISFAGSTENAMKFATEAAERGAVRFPTPGKMLNFESPWDGMYVMERLVRWNTLGGPIK